MIQDEQRIAGDGAGKDLMDARDLVGHDRTEGVLQLGQRVNRDGRDLEKHAVTREL